VASVAFRLEAFLEKEEKLDEDKKLGYIKPL